MPLDGYINMRIFIVLTLLLTACASNTKTFPDDKWDEWVSQAEAGQAEAQYKLGKSYAANKDYANAVIWLQKSANQNNPKAQNGLSMLYMQGLGVPKDEHKALEWLKKSAEGGYPTAQYNVAMLYKNGRLIAKDDVQAALWLHQAAQQGDDKAQTQLALCYEQGLGVPQDTRQALEWLEKAAGKNNAEARAHLQRIQKNLR
ncbi:Secretory immunoglobulin A-binding protein EsiB [Patescibacteria group bacterium]|nr:Secretory immunoglobulin A-binding protein EsiB [Patescibacteria group bacterium]